MKDPRRLSEQPANDVERMLLRAGRVSPPPGSMEAAWASAAAALAASPTPAEQPASGGGATTAMKASSPGLAKAWLLSCLLGLGLVAVGAAVFHGLHPRAVSRAVPSAFAPPSVSGDPAIAPSNGAPDSAIGFFPRAIKPETEREEPTPATSSERRSDRAKRSAGAARSDSDGPNVSTELAMLDEARRAMNAGDPAHARSTLAAYRAKFPNGVMAPEASVIRIDVLERAGEREAATRLASQFLQTDPGSVYVARVRSILARPNP